MKHAQEALALADVAGAAGANERSAAEHIINAIILTRGDAKAAEPRLREMLTRDLAQYGEASRRRYRGLHAARHDLR